LRAHERAIELDPRHADALHQSAVLLGRAGRHEQAIERFLEVIELEPTNARARRNLAEAYVRLGRYDLAVAELERALAIDPSNGRAWGKLERCHERLGNVKEAAKARAEREKIEAEKARRRTPGGE